MAKVVLSGYYGFDNTGDEAILYSIIQALRDKKPAIDITVLSNNPAKTQELYGVKAVNRWRLNEAAGAIKGCDMLISGGGSLLQDVTGLKSLGYYLGVVALARSLGKPVFFYAQGIGPVTSRAGRLMMKLVVNRVQKITVRDEQSKNELQAMGVNRPPTAVTADPVLGLEISEEDRRLGRQILESHGIDFNKPVLGVSVRDWKGSTGTLKQELARCCDRFVEKGWQVLFLPLHHPGDIAPCRETAGFMKNSSAVLAGNYNVQEFIGITSSCTMLVGMRLHSLVFAARAAVPLVGISYDPKIDSFLKQLNLTPACRVEDEKYDILPYMEKVSADLEGERQRLKEAVKVLEKKALHTAELVCRML